MLWPHAQSHYGTKGSFKFYHNGVTYRIPSSKGVLQGDPLSSPLFALALHPLLIQTVQEVPDLLTHMRTTLNIKLLGLLSLGVR